MYSYDSVQPGRYQGVRYIELAANYNVEGRFLIVVLPAEGTAEPFPITLQHSLYGNAEYLVLPDGDIENGIGDVWIEDLYITEDETLSLTAQQTGGTAKLDSVWFNCERPDSNGHLYAQMMLRIPTGAGDATVKIVARVTNAANETVGYGEKTVTFSLVDEKPVVDCTLSGQVNYVVNDAGYVHIDAPTVATDVPAEDLRYEWTTLFDPEVISATFELTDPQDPLQGVDLYIDPDWVDVLYCSFAVHSDAFYVERYIRVIAGDAGLEIYSSIEDAVSLPVNGDLEQFTAYLSVDTVIGDDVTWTLSPVNPKRSLGAILRFGERVLSENGSLTLEDQQEQYCHGDFQINRLTASAGDYDYVVTASVLAQDGTVIEGSRNLRITLAPATQDAPTVTLKPGEETITGCHVKEVVRLPKPTVTWSASHDESTYVSTNWSCNSEDVRFWYLNDDVYAMFPAPGAYTLRYHVKENMVGSWVDVTVHVLDDEDAEPQADLSLVTLMDDELLSGPIDCGKKDTVLLLGMAWLRNPAIAPGDTLEFVLVPPEESTTRVWLYHNTASMVQIFASFSWAGVPETWKLQVYHNGTLLPDELSFTLSVTDVYLDRRGIMLIVGDKQQLSVVRTVPAGRDVIWSSLNPQVATVDENGMVTAIANGTTYVLATMVGSPGTVTNCGVHVTTMYTMYLPPNLTVVDDEAFVGDRFPRVVASDGLTTIGSRAFADNRALRLVELPASVTTIADDAFEGCNELMEFVCPKGSYVETFAVEHGFGYYNR